ncbi:DUF1572 family protein [Flavihumibacter petaseus]|uniref:DinB-like domain-containing protein n=1 Tax=Flavihumibacter petaseus NBRC 106054 TaxID=1220578 RepID=A0A0E9N0T6_9BACT|nr:DUF1572 family protein [Flavihumibacter petaseus]GAO43373.1 hypothetical protein FPE01S_02_04780 [Flavihumibacter petaseus NBRC 106054]
MIIDTLKSLFRRDLNKLRQELELYRHEENIWKKDKQIANAAGNLCLHLVGNLNTYIGKEIGATDYIRNRDLEFSQKMIPREDLLRMIDDTIHVVDVSLEKLYGTDLERDYPIVVFDRITSMHYMLVHLATHLAYHLGQVNYHRRLLDETQDPG